MSTPEKAPADSILLPFTKVELRALLNALLIVDQSVCYPSDIHIRVREKVKLAVEAMEQDQ